MDIAVVSHSGSGLVSGARAPTVTGEVTRLVARQMRALAAGRSQADVDDLVQAALEQVVRALPRFEGRSKLATFTYRICFSTLLKHDRWYRRWRRRFELTRAGELPERADTKPSAEQAMREERMRRMRAAIDRLSARRREVVFLHDIEGLGVDAIAEMIGANALTVRSRLRDGRRDLARRLAGDPYFEAGERPRRAASPWSNRLVVAAAVTAACLVLVMAAIRSRSATPSTMAVSEPESARLAPMGTGSVPAPAPVTGGDAEERAQLEEAEHDFLNGQCRSARPVLEALRDGAKDPGVRERARVLLGSRAKK